MKLKPRKFKELGWGIQGDRGAGKDAFGSWLASIYMLGGVPCYSNMMIDAVWQEGHVKTRNLFTSQLLTMGKSFINSQNEEVEGLAEDCVIYLSEMDKLVHKFRRTSNANMILRILATQIRKNGYSFIGTAQDWFWVDPDWVFQTDVLVCCHELAFTNYGRENNMPEGYESYIEMFDLKGVFGYKYKDTGKPYYTCNFTTRKMWDPLVNGGQGPLYDSYQTFGLEEMLTKIVLDKKERHIGPASVDMPNSSKSVSGLVPRSKAFSYLDSSLSALRNHGVSKIDDAEMRSLLVNAGYQGNFEDMDTQAAKLGLKRIKTKTGCVYSLDNV